MKVHETTYEQHKCDMNTFVIILHELHSLAQFVSFSAFILLFSCSISFVLFLCLCVSPIYLLLEGWFFVSFTRIISHSIYAITRHRAMDFGALCFFFLFFACNSEPIALMEYVQRCIQFYIHFVSADTMSIWSHYIVTETILWRNLRLMRPTRHPTLH